MRFFTLFLFLVLFALTLTFSPAAATDVEVSVRVHTAGHRRPMHRIMAPIEQQNQKPESEFALNDAEGQDPTPKTPHSVSVHSYGLMRKLGEFKIVEKRDREGRVVTKRGKPVRYLIPLASPSDPVFRPYVKMPKDGMNGEEFVDTHQSYSAKLLTDEQCKERGIPKNEGDLVFANFRHENQWFIARFQPGSVQEVRALTTVFKKIAGKPLMGHQMGRYILKPGKELELYPQTPNQKKPMVGKIGDFISSNEGAYTIDEDTLVVNGYDPVTSGMLDGFVIAHKFYSFPQYAYQRIALAALHESMIESRLDSLTDAEKSAVVEQAIKLADERGMSHFYNTLTNSCSTTFFFDTLDVALEKTRPQHAGLWDRIKRRILPRLGRNPAWQRVYLERRRLPYTTLTSFLDDVKRVRPTLNNWQPIQLVL